MSLRKISLVSSQPMSKYQHDTVVPFEQSTDSKKKQVANMFDQIAFRYDFLNRFLSGGIDVYWRKKAVAELKEIQPKILLDVATGTGDLAIMAEKYLHPSKITGIDISEGMLEKGREKLKRIGKTAIITLESGDSEAINFPDSSFDAITVAFGVRNFQDLEKGLQEMLRVLKPGGKLVVLEFSKPKQSLFKGFYNVYMKVVTPGIGTWISKNKEAYKYLTSSVKAFPEGETFLHILNKTGFTNTYLKRLSLGICTIYCGRKKHG